MVAFVRQTAGELSHANDLNQLQVAIERLTTATYDVREFGAVGDGTTNDATAIQAAIDLVNGLGGGTVFFPASATDYLITSPLTLYSGVKLKGAGRRKSRIKVSATSVNGVNLVGASAGSIKVLAELEDIALIGPGKAAGGTGIGLNVKWVNYGCAFTRVWIFGWASAGLHFEDSYSSSFTDIEIDSCGGIGLEALTNVNACDFRRVSVYDCGAGIQIIGGAGNRMMVACEANDSYGLDLRYVYGSIVEGSYFENNTTANIYLHYKTSIAEPCNGITLIGNYVSGSSSTARGLIIDSANRTTVIGNTFNNHVTDHIQTIVSNATRTWIGPNLYLGTGTQLTDGSTTTGGVDYDTTNLWTRTRGKHFFSGEIEIDGALNHDGTTVGFFGVTPAVRPTTYSATNVTVDRTYDANATTLDEVADVLGTLISDLRSLGLVT